MHMHIIIAVIKIADIFFSLYGMYIDYTANQKKCQYFCINFRKFSLADLHFF